MLTKEWKKLAPPKVGLMLWQVLQGRIQTKELRPSFGGIGGLSLSCVLKELVGEQRIKGGDDFGVQCV